MSQPPTLIEEEEAGPPPLRARRALLKRLADVVSLPASRINAFERSVVGDLLVDMLRLASPEERRRVAGGWPPWPNCPTPWPGCCCATRSRSPRC